MEFNKLNCFITRKLLKEGDLDKYYFIQETREDFKTNSIPDSKKVEIALKYLDYFYRIMENDLL